MGDILAIPTSQIDKKLLEDIEAPLLGAMISSQGARNDLPSWFKPSMLAIPENRAIASTILDMDNEGETINKISLHKRLTEKGIINQVGGPAYLTSLVNYFIGEHNLHEWCCIVAQEYIRRQLMLHGKRLVERCSSEADLDIFDLLDKARAHLDALTSEVNPTQLSVSTQVSQLAKDLSEGDTPIPCGIPVIDKEGGLWPRELTYLGASPGHGKTAALINIALSLIDQGVPVLIISMELSHQDILLRLISHITEIPFNKLRRGFSDLTKNEITAFNDACGVLFEAPLTIIDAQQTPSQIDASIRKLHRQDKASVALIDYLQHVSPEHERQKESEVCSRASAILKVAAKELKIPIVCLTQINQEHGKEPSGAIIQQSRKAAYNDASNIYYLWRPDKHGVEYYHQGGPTRGTIAWYAEKTRNSDTPSGFQIMMFELSCGKMHDLNQISSEPGITDFYAPF